MTDPSQMVSIAIWMLIVLTAFVFAASGVLKLAGDSFGNVGQAADIPAQIPGTT